MTRKKHQANATGLQCLAESLQRSSHLLPGGICQSCNRKAEIRQFGRNVLGIIRRVLKRINAFVCGIANHQSRQVEFHAALRLNTMVNRHVKCFRHCARIEAGSEPIMYGPPQDCKGKASER